MAVNKVVYGTTVLVDLTEDTVTPQSLLLGNRAHAADGTVVNGTLTGSQTGVLVKIPNISCTYVSGTSVTIDISGRTDIYRDITLDQIIVEFTHLGFYASGLVFGGSINADVSLQYNASTGIITLTTSATAFSNTVTSIVTVYITEQAPEVPKTAQTVNVTPSAAAQTITPDAGCELTSVEVAPVTSSLISTLDSDFRASNIRAGVDILGLVGTLNPEGGSFDPTPWADVEVGQITPSSAQSSFPVDTNKGTPLGLIISLANKNGVSQTTNCLINASWAASPAQSVYARSVCYATSYSTSQTTSYPTYSNGSFNLYRSLRAGWTYNYCIIYGT